jgi:hypothetical protein
LEEGEIMAEPTPGKKDRRALFFYEAAEGGAGALSRLVNDRDGFRSVARAALVTMHIDKDSIDAANGDPAALAEVPAPRCVAGCYRCLLSYFNQPDHELIDRRKTLVLSLLLRMAASDSRAANAASSSTNDGDPPGCPPSDGPIAVDGFTVPWFWRAARVAAVIQGEAPDGLSDTLAAKGVDLHHLPRDPAERSAALTALAEALRTQSN